MTEGFKLNALKLRRTLKISVNLPEDYNYTIKRYPMLICFDGQDLFNFILEETLKINMPELIKKNKSDIIAIGIQAPKIPEWRISEFNPYYSGNVDIVDKSLAFVFLDYISKELIPLLRGKYRVSNTYILAFHEATIQALDMLYRDDSIHGGFFLSPKLKDCDMLYFLESLKAYYRTDKKCYLYLGGKNSTTEDLNNFMSIYTTLDSLKSTNLDLVYEESEGNDYSDIEKQITKILKLLSQ